MKKFNLSSIIFIILVLINIMLIFFVQPIKVSGFSMYPSYKDKQYGLSIKFKPMLKNVERFDVVVVESEKTKNTHWVKRLIGMPGETIEYKNDKLYVNGKYVDEPFLNTDYVKNYRETNIVNFTCNFKIELKENEYLLLGDNRPKSMDSRFVGPFHLEDITSKKLIGF